MMGLAGSIGGRVLAELTSADPAGALAAISAEGIHILRARTEGALTLRVWVLRRNYGALSRLAEKRGETLRLLGRGGIYWHLLGLLRRPLLGIGISCLLALALFLPSRIWFVEVEGNGTVPTKLILEAADASGIRFGASRQEVRSEKMKNQLLAALPELQWAGVNTYGCVAVISVRERSLPQEPEDTGQVGSIVASRDGIILSCTAEKGSLQCTVGQAVRSGDVLISGFTDCGLTVTATRAEGEILARTRRELTAVTPTDSAIRVQKGTVTVKYSLRLGKKRINFYKGSGIWDTSCGKMYTEYHLTLPGGFQLPVTLVREEYTAWETADGEETQPEAQLTQFAAAYLKQSMVAGSVISGEERFASGEGLCILTGDYACNEMIGSWKQEQIGEYNGKTN